MNAMVLAPTREAQTDAPNPDQLYISHTYCRPQQVSLPLCHHTSVPPGLFIVVVIALVVVIIDVRLGAFGALWGI